MFGTYIYYYFRKSKESASKRPALDDLLDTCKSYLVQAKVVLLKVVVQLAQKSSASKENYSHLSNEETLETLESFSRRLYG